MNTNNMLKQYKNKKIFPGEEVYLTRSDSLDFISKCEKYKIPIFRIEIVKLTEFETVSSLDKIFDCDDQIDVYSDAKSFIKSQMDDEWNYATFVTD